MAEVTMILDTSFGYFVTWIQMHTFDVNSRYRFPVNGGRMALQRLRSVHGIGGGHRFEMTCQRFVLSDDGLTETESACGPGISFTLIPLGPNRLQVKAECDKMEVLGDYFQGLLSDSEERWPQRRDSHMPVGAQTKSVPDDTPPVKLQNVDEILAIIPTERHRNIVRMYCYDGKSSTEIEALIDYKMTAESVTKLIVKLRKKFGEGVVPYKYGAPRVKHG